MKYWQGGFVPDILLVICLLGVAALLRRSIAPLKRLGLPDSILAGMLGLVLGPTGFDFLPISSANLESVVYHGVGLIFAAITLQSPPPRGARHGMLSCIFVIPFMAAMQGIIGLSVVLGWNAVSGKVVHTGLGMVLPLGFNQGPGGAMTLGGAWEAGAGMQDGAQIGLIMAAAGFIWCCAGGLVIISMGKKRQWMVPTTHSSNQNFDSIRTAAQPTAAAAGSMEPLVAQAVAIAVVYYATYLFVDGIAPLLPAKHEPTLWGLHFVIAGVFALLMRHLLDRLPNGSPLNDELLVRSSSVFIELTTASALAAVQLGILAKWWGPVVLVSTLGGVFTAFATLWLARRAFPESPFEHAVIVFGAMTGTTATGLALLRLVDPDFRGPAARNFVLAASAATLLAGPLLMLMPYPVFGFAENYLQSLLTSLGILIVYAAVIVIAWRRVGALRLFGSSLTLWPDPKK